MKALLGWAVAVMIAFPARAEAQASSTTDSAVRATPQQLVGSYRLAWLEVPSPGGTRTRITSAKGSLIYTPAGQIAVQVMYAASDTTSSEYSLGGYEASFGQYVVDEATRTVTHHYDGSLVRSLLGQDIPRRYEFVDGRLIIRSTRPDEQWSVAWERY